MRIYQTGPLFTPADISWQKDFKRQWADAVYVVQWPGNFYSQQEFDALGADAAKVIMEKDRTAIDGCDVVIALLDDPQVDDRTAWEIGYAYAKGKPVVGIRTDFRKSGDTKHGSVNAMIEGSCLGIAKDFDEVLKFLDNVR